VHETDEGKVIYDGKSNDIESVESIGRAASAVIV